MFSVLVLLEGECLKIMLNLNMQDFFCNLLHSLFRQLWPVSFSLMIKNHLYSMMLLTPCSIVGMVFQRIPRNRLEHMQKWTSHPKQSIMHNIQKKFFLIYLEYWAYKPFTIKSTWTLNPCVLRMMRAVKFVLDIMLSMMVRMYSFSLIWPQKLLPVLGRTPNMPFGKLQTACLILFFK